jgi:hypothetical protein
MDIDVQNRAIGFIHRLLENNTQSHVINQEATKNVVRKEYAGGDGTRSGQHLHRY